MSGSFYPRRFANPATLRTIARPLLLAFLAPHRDFLASRGLRLTDSSDFDYGRLAKILMSPDAATPGPLLDAMFFVDEGADGANHEDLLEAARTHQIALPEGSRITTADLTLRIWLANPNVIETLHAERFLVRPRSFEYFLSASDSLPELPMPSEQVLYTLEEDLNDWFETRKRGRSARVFPFEREDGLWFLVRHGAPYKREGTIEATGASSSVYYRPEKFDVLIYKRRLGELAINARSQGQVNKYREAFGRHLFGSEAFFARASRLASRFTLDPIVDLWERSVACDDVDGIDWVRLQELDFRHYSTVNNIEVQKADDVFEAIAQSGRWVPPTAMLQRASFRVKFSGRSRPRTLVIRPPNVASFTREEDNDLLMHWMSVRGFALGKETVGRVSVGIPLALF